LSRCVSVGQLFKVGAEVACREFGFARGVVLSAYADRLCADTTDALTNPASDALRRRVLSAPIRLSRGSAEAEALQAGAEHPRATPPSRGLVERLDLGQAVSVPVAPEGRVLAVILLDRPAPQPQSLELSGLEAFAAMFAVSLETVLVRGRMEVLQSELRSAAMSTQALVAEALQAPASLPSHWTHSLAFPATHVADRAASGTGNLRDILTPREIEVAYLLVEGLTNRQIAERMILSPETIKASVARILRKLDASNRAQAVSRFLQLAGAGSAN
jgi:DNA-binding CsgD family transcriptional regulator